MTPFKKLSLLAVGLLAFGGVLSALSTPVKTERSGEPAAGAGLSQFDYAGTASCSARNCHGNDRPNENAIAQQNEYTHMLLYDKHTQAYAVLLSERAKTMARNLSATNPGGKEVPAHEDWRCLACHTTPQAAWEQSQGKSADLSTQNWQIGGVSCEACHGPSRTPIPGQNETWLQTHTAPDSWAKKLSPSQKESYGFWNLSDPARQAQICAGCHVGAPPDTKSKNKAPARDCNHDIMAAGHPRLNFELSVYRANLPPHWNVQRKEKGLRDKGGDRALSEEDARVWLLGRVGSAKASLELLDYRAGQAEKGGEGVRWPEFAESRCYACHKDLNNDWKSAENEPGRPRGSLPYDSWYSALLPSLNPRVADGYKKLSAEMAKPWPNPETVRTTAAELIKVHDEWLKSEKSFKPDDLLKTITKDVPKLPRAWEDSMQLTLGLAALKRADLVKGSESVVPLRKMAEALSFPSKDYKGEGPDGIKYPADLEAAQKAYADFLKK